MPRPRKTPSYRLHKARNCGVVTIDGKDHYLGPYDSPESWEKYYQLLAGWAGNGHTKSPCPPTVECDQTVNQLIALYWRFAQGWYIKDGEPTDAIYGVKAALRVLREMYGTTLVREFGPLRLQALLTHMVEKGWSRTYCNDNLGRIKRMFRWGKSQEIVPSTVYQDLLTVDGLRAGRTEAKELRPVRHSVIGRVEDIGIVQFAHGLELFQDTADLNVDILAAGEFSAQFISDRALVAIRPDTTDIHLVANVHVRIVEGMSRQVIDRQARLLRMGGRQEILVPVVGGAVLGE